jgi:hypothetical protein
VILVKIISRAVLLYLKKLLLKIVINMELCCHVLEFIFYPIAKLLTF